MSAPSRVFAFDTETHLIRPGILAPKLVCVSWMFEDDENYTLQLADDGLDTLEAVLRDDAIHIVGHNVAFDFGVACAMREHLIPLVFDAYAKARVSDTRVREKLIRLALGEMTSDFAQAAGAKRQAKFDLATIFLNRFNMDLSGDKNDPTAWRLRYSELDGVPLDLWPEKAKAYAGEDAMRHLLLFCEQRVDARHIFGEELDGFCVNEFEKACTAWALHLAGIWGVRTDKNTVSALNERLEGEISATKSVATDMAIFRAKDGSRDNAVLSKIITEAYNRAGLPVPCTAGRVDKKTGQRVPSVATDKETLLNAPPEHQPHVDIKVLDRATSTWTVVRKPILKALADISAAAHNHTTYIPVLFNGASFPLNPGWNELLESGRTSCYNPNVQNLPRSGGYRECFVPRPGWVYINCDYSTIELRALAQVCLDLFGHSAMAEALRAGKDLHVDMAADLLGIDYETAVAWQRGEHGPEKKKILKDYRQMSKALNFGFPGGLGPDTAIEYSWTTWGVKYDPDPVVAREKVVAYKKAWLKKWPEVEEFFAYVSAQTARGGGLFTLTQPRSGRLRGGAGYCDGCNSHFQGLAADGATAALFIIQMESYTGYSMFWTREEHGDVMSPLYGSRQTMFVHDEFIGEAREEVAAEAAERLAEVARLGMQLYIDGVPVEVEPVLMRRWLKNAETVRDEAGRLVPWEEKGAA